MLKTTELVLLARDGNEQAWTDLVPRVRGYLIALAIDKGYSHKADEVAQETLYRAFLVLHTLVEPAHFKTWLTRIALNIIVDSRRQDSRLDGPPQDSMAAPDARLDERLIEEERRKQLQAAIQSLPPRQAHVISRRLAGESYETISRDLGITANAAKLVYHRALTTLKEALS